MIQKFIGLFASKKFTIFLFFLCLFTFLTPNLFRGNENGLIGEEAYFYIGITEQMLDDGLLNVYDQFSYGGREYDYVFPWAVILYLLNLLFGIPLNILSVFLPYTLSILSFILIYFILKSFKFTIEQTNIGMLLLIISPTFLFLSSTSNKYILPFFLSLLAFYLFIHKNEVLKNTSFVVFILLPFFSLTMTLISLFLLLLYIYFYKKGDATFFWAIFGSVISLSVLGIFFPIISTSPFLDLFLNTSIQKSSEGINPFLMDLISDFGGDLGIGIFSLFLSIIGLFLIWWYKKNVALISVSLLFLILLSAKKIEPFIYLNVFVALLSAIAIMEIAQLKWTSRVMKNFTILVIICGIVFSSISYINELRSELPNKNIIKSLEFIKGTTPVESTVLSYYKNGFWIESFAKRKTVMDSYFIGANDVEERYKDLQNLFKTRNIDKAMEILKKYEVNYIYVDNAMRQETWKYDEEGFLFLLKYSDNFKKIYLDDFVTIWRVEA